MRILSYVPAKHAFDPKTKSLRESFNSKSANPTECYNLFIDQGNVYVFRDGHGAIFMSHGVVYLVPEKAAELEQRYCQKWPFPPEKTE